MYLWSAVSCRSRPGPFFRSNSICDLLILCAVLDVKGGDRLSLCAYVPLPVLELKSSATLALGESLSDTHVQKESFFLHLSFTVCLTPSVADLLQAVSTQAQTDSLRSLRTASRTWQLRQAFLPSVFPSLSSSPEWRMATCSARDLFYRTNPSCRLHSVRGHVQNLWNLEIYILKGHTISSGCELQH